MAINLTDLKRKKVRKYIRTEDKDHPVEIYEPTQEQRLKILDIINKDIKVGTNKLEASIKDEDILLEILEMITNIYLDLDKVKDKELIEDILKDPSPLLIKVKLCINEIVNEVFFDWFESLKQINSMPTEIQEVLLEQNENKINEKEKKRIELLKMLEQLDKEE